MLTRSTAGTPVGILAYSRRRAGRLVLGRAARDVSASSRKQQDDAGGRTSGRSPCFYVPTKAAARAGLDAALLDASGRTTPLRRAPGAVEAYPVDEDLAELPVHGLSQDVEPLASARTGKAGTRRTIMRLDPGLDRIRPRACEPLSLSSIM